MSRAYIYKIGPSRPDMIQTMTQAEEAAIDEHFSYLKAALEKGRLVIAGPCEDAAFGIVVFYAESDEAAQAFMKDDPVVREKVMVADLHRFRVSLLTAVS